MANSKDTAANHTIFPEKLQPLTSHKPQQINKLLQSPQQLLGILHQHVAALAELEPFILAVLPSELRNHCQVANIDGHKLVLLVNSPAYGNLLRMYQSNILQQLAKKPRTRHIQSLRWLVRPEQTARERTLSSPKPISADAASIMRDCALTLKDEELRAALLKWIDDATNT